MTELLSNEVATQATVPGGGKRVTLEDLVHVGPGTLNGRYQRMFWHPVLLASELEVRRAKPLRILGEDFTLYRGESGEIHAVANLCAHRATQLSTGYIEGECIRCFYHGWKYDESGQCVDQPDEDPAFKKNIKIRSYPVREYIGMIFMYFGEDQPPELPRFPQFEDDSDGVRTWNTYTWPCSYLNGYENDSFHVNWVHREQVAEWGVLTQPGQLQIDTEETEYGFFSRQRRLGDDVKTQRETLRHNIMPNIRMRRSSGSNTRDPSDERPSDPEDAWGEACRWSVPVDDDHFRNINIQKTYLSGEDRERYELVRQQRRAARQELEPAPEIAERILRGEITQWDFPGKLGVNDPRNFNVCDYITQVGQGTAAVLRPNHLGPRGDVEPLMFRRIMMRELQTLADGRPLKRWNLPDRLVVRISED